MNFEGDYCGIWKLIFASLLFVVATNAACNVCQKNQAACVNTTSFYLCFGENWPNSKVMYHCKDGFDCTDLNAICVQTSSMRKPSCGDISQCGLCSAHRNFLFACTSRTTFRMCYGASHPSGQIGNCPTGFVCDADSDAICVSSTMPHKVTCDIQDTAVTPTASTTDITPSSVVITEPTTKLPPTSADIYPMTPTEVCAQRREVGLFPTVPKDPRCLRYIFCYFISGVIKGIENRCADGTYYNIEKEQCTYNKPLYCQRTT